MNSRDIWKYLQGYVIINVDGLSLEKFVNRAVNEGIDIWDVRRVSDTRITAKTTMRSFLVLRKVTRKLACKVSIAAKRGFPARTKGFRFRRVLVVGAVLAVLAIAVMTSFVWTVELEGGEDLDRDKIMEQLLDLGIRPGAATGSLDVKAAQNRLLIDNPELAWVGINVKGVRVFVTLHPAEPPPEIPEYGCSNIVADKDAVIESIYATAGKAMVREGDSVKKGDVLISGVHAVDGMPTRLVNAAGEIKAKTEYTGEGEAPMYETKRVPTGRTFEASKIAMGSWIIWLKRPGAGFADYDVETRKQEVIGAFFPVWLITEKYVEISAEKNPLPEGAVQLLAEYRAFEAASKDIPKNALIVERIVEETLVEGDTMKLRMRVVSRERIGKRVEVKI